MQRTGLEKYGESVFLPSPLFFLLGLNHPSKFGFLWMRYYAEEAVGGNLTVAVSACSVAVAPNVVAVTMNTAAVSLRPRYN